MPKFTRQSIGMLIFVLCLTLCNSVVSATGISDNPYYDQSAYLKPTDQFVEGTVKNSGQDISYSVALPFAQGNVFYVPLRDTLTACGISTLDILWENGVITIKFEDHTISTRIDSDAWTFDDGNPHQTRNGHVILQDGNTFVPKDMVDEWRLALGTSCLDELEITACYCPNGGDWAAIIYN